MKQDKKEIIQEIFNNTNINLKKYIIKLSTQSIEGKKIPVTVEFVRKNNVGYGDFFGKDGIALNYGGEYSWYGAGIPLHTFMREASTVANSGFPQDDIIIAAGNSLLSFCQNQTPSASSLTGMFSSTTHTASMDATAAPEVRRDPKSSPKSSAASSTFSGH